MKGEEICDRIEGRGGECNLEEQWPRRGLGTHVPPSQIPQGVILKGEKELAWATPKPLNLDKVGLSLSHQL